MFKNIWRKDKMRKFLSLMTLFVITLLAGSLVSAIDSTLSIDSVKVNGDEVGASDVLAIQEGESFTVKVMLKNTAATDLTNVELEATIAGYEYGTLSTTSGLFDIAAGTSKPVSLTLDLPKKLEKNEYWLRLRVMDEHSEARTMNVRLAVEPARHGIDISDVSFSPSNTVKAGRSLLATVLLQNFGDKDEKDVKVTVAIPELGVQATEYTDVKMTNEPTNIHNINYQDVPEVFLPIPANAKEGTYQVTVTAEYDQLTQTVTKSFPVSIVANELYQNADKLVLAVGPDMQTVAPGHKATYGIALTNAGTTSKAFVLQTVTGDWATATLSESLVVLEPGKNQIVYVDLTPADDATVGAHTASVTVTSSGQTLQTVTLNAVVVQSTAAATASGDLNLRNGLEIALVILVVVLVIIGLIIGFSRLRKDDEGEQKYY